LEELEDLEFLYAHGPQLEEYKLKEQKKFVEEEKSREEVRGYFSQSLSRDGSEVSVAEYVAGTYPQIDIDLRSKMAAVMSLLPMSLLRTCMPSVMLRAVSTTSWKALLITRQMVTPLTVLICTSRMALTNK
jgi:hypothetical protein